MRWLGWAARVVGLVGALLLLSACHQNGTVFAVNTTADTVDVDPGDGLCADVNGDCSLRAATLEAGALPGVEEIRLVDGETYVLTITGEDQEYVGDAGDLDIFGAVVITGDATIDANGIDRVIDLYPVAGLVEIDGPDLTGGSAANGPAIELQAPSQLTLMRSNVYGNTGSGTGAIAAFGGSHFVWSSTFFDNDTDSHIASFGATVDLQNVTMTRDPGGPVAVRPTAGSTTKIRFSTLMGGAAFVDATGVVALDRSIVSGCSGPATSTGFSIGLDATCGLTQPSDLPSTDPLLGPLADNGGSVLTMLPADASPAVDGGGNPSPLCTLFALDARDVRRVAGPACDIGAVELEVGADCAPLNLVQYADLRRCDLSGMDLSGIPSIAFSDLTGASFAGSNLANADLYGTTARGVDFTGANLDVVDFYTADLTGSTITDATVNATEFSFAVLDGVRSGGLTGTPLPFTDGHQIIGGYLVGPRVDLGGADLDGLDLSGADLAGVRSGGITGVPGGLPFGFRLVDGYLVGPGADLRGADLAGSDLTGTNLDDADLTDADLSSADLRFSVIRRAEVGGADFGGADLTGAIAAGLTGTPAALPAEFVLESGLLVGPGIDLYEVDLGTADLSAAVLRGVSSFAVTGTPTLPPGYVILGGHLIGPEVNLMDADLGTLDLSAIDLTGVSSGGVIGSPILPPGWALWNGYLVGSGADLTDADLSGLDLTGIDLSDVTLDRVRSGGTTGTPLGLPNSWRLLSPADGGYLVGPRADLTGAVIPGGLVGATLTDAWLVNADLTGADLFIAHIDGADFTGATLTGVRSGGVAGTPVGLPTGWQLTGGYLIGPGADLSFAVLPFDLTGADLSDTILSGTDLTGATLTGVRSGGITGTQPFLPSGWSLRANYLGSGYLVGPGADLSGADLSLADLSGTDLTATDLSGADLGGADLMGATVTGADFTGSFVGAIASGGLVGIPAVYPTGFTIRNGYLVGPGADLSGEALAGALLFNLDLSGAMLDGANLSFARLDGTDLDGATLAGATVQGLRTGGITGDPASLPTDVTLRSGYLIGPTVSLNGAVLAGVDLSGVRSGGITGTPASLPTGFVLSNGYLGGPYADLTGANLNSVDFEFADLYGVVSSALTGFPSGLPQGVKLIDSHLIGPGVDLTGVSLTSSAELYRIKSGGLSGTPTVIPSDWRLYGGYLIGPGADLRGASLTPIAGGSLLFSLDLTNVLLDGSDFTGANFNGTDFTGAVWGTAVLADTSMIGTTLSTTNMSGTTLTGVEAVNIVGAPTLPSPWKLIGGRLLGPGAVVNNANFDGANLTGVDLSNSTMYGITSGTYTGSPILTGSNYREVKTGFFALGAPVLLGPGAIAPSIRVEEVTPQIGGLTCQLIDLLAGIGLTKVPAPDDAKTWAYAQFLALREGFTDCFSGISATLCGLNLRDADLRGLVYVQTEVTVVNMPSCGFRGTNLAGANLSNANLEGQDLTGAYVGGTDFTGASLVTTETWGLFGSATEAPIGLPSTFRFYCEPGVPPSFAVGTELHGGCAFFGPDVSLTNTVIDVTGANLDNVNLSGARLSGLVLTTADVPRSYLYAQNEPGNCPFNPNPPADAFPTGSLFSMRNANFSFADMSANDFSLAGELTVIPAFPTQIIGGDLSGSTFTSTEASGSIYSGPTLICGAGPQVQPGGARFLYSDLTGATTFLANFTNAAWIGATCPDGVAAGDKPDGACF